MSNDRDVAIAKIAKTGKRAFIFGVLGLFLLMTGCGSYYVVQQNEVGAVLRMGSLVSLAPVPPGLHFKAPFIDTAHMVRVSIEKIPIPDIKAKTVDNQFVGIGLNLSYHTGDPFKVLFKVGDIGDTSIHDKVIPYVQSRVLDEIGKVNALQITDNKGVIEANILKDIRQQVLDLFGEYIDDVQITAIDYDPTFTENVQSMVKTRNQQISAKNLLDVITTEAQQAAAKAEGEKQKTIKEAEAAAAQVKLSGDAQAYATLAKAHAEAEATKAVGDAEAAVITLKVNSAGNADAYANILRAEAQKNWNGAVPTYSFGGGGSSVVPLLQLPSK